MAIVKKYQSIDEFQKHWKTLEPNEHGDWISKRNDVFDTFISIEPEKKFDVKAQSFFSTYAIGVATNRDAWVYNSSKRNVESNMRNMISFYNEQQTLFGQSKDKNSKLEADDFIDMDSTKISWTVNLKKDLEKRKEHKFDKSKFETVSYRPYFKQFLYFDKPFIERPGLNSAFFPNKDLKNVVISVTGAGASKPFSVIATNSIPNLDNIEKAQCFPLYYFEERQKQNPGIFDDAGDSEFIRRDGVSDFILERAKKLYGSNVGKEDIFYYVYGFLHSPEYRKMFANDLKKMLPRLPLVEDVKDFYAFSKAGRKLAELHLNYETVPAYDGVTVTGDDGKFYIAEKMRFPKKDQKDTIHYNSKITVSNIPAKAYEYVVNGKSAIEWIMERYAVTTHKESGIKNDPNDWATEVGNPRYILDLLLSVINVSLQTVNIVEGLPKVKFE